VQQLAVSRAQLAAVLSQTSLQQQLHEGIRAAHSMQRLCMQKSCMKYVRQCVQYSQLEVFVADICKKARDEVRAVQSQSLLRSSSASNHGNSDLDLIREVVRVVEDLSFTTSLSGFGASQIAGGLLRHLNYFIFFIFMYCCR
jgi:hypothetical protein